MSALIKQTTPISPVFSSNNKSCVAGTYVQISLTGLIELRIALQLLAMTPSKLCMITTPHLNYFWGGFASHQ